MDDKKKNHLDIDHSSLIGKKYDMYADLSLELNKK